LSFLSSSNLDLLYLIMFSEGIGQRIRFYRKKLGYTQEVLAELSDVTDATQISKFEKNMRRPSLDILASISKALNVDLGTLYDGTPQKKKFSDNEYKRILKSSLKLTENDKILVKAIINKLIANQWKQGFITLGQEMMRSENENEVMLDEF